jgi:tripartite-type tricarboxylate transporter receptor subunit TctC
MAESGFPGFEEYTQGLGIVGPRGVPAAAVDKLNAAVRASVAKPETRARLAALGAVTQPGSPQELTTWLKQDAERWARVIKAAGVKEE